jgi:hypothetical protein
MKDLIETTKGILLEESEKQKKYQAFFKKALKKFGAKSPAELDDEKKKEFFDYIDKNWKGEDEKKESVKEASVEGSKEFDAVVDAAEGVEQRLKALTMAIEKRVMVSVDDAWEDTDIAHMKKAEKFLKSIQKDVSNIEKKIQKFG